MRRLLKAVKRQHVFFIGVVALAAPGQRRTPAFVNQGAAGGRESLLALPARQHLLEALKLLFPVYKPVNVIGHGIVI